MEPAEVESRIESAIDDAEVTVTHPRPNDTEHLAAEVISPAFDGKTLVEQHELVYDALGEAMTTEIHALKVTTRTPAEANSGSDGTENC
ncbi:BolA family protein [Halorhabdus rudnickae]|uniref:BolA family protein n=1 Tax=Halorhabdus rudnickae TaxID=1775544 RepID=UPI0010826538|nr:BolA family protein [Halorhabdus rudnickae]